MSAFDTLLQTLPTLPRPILERVAQCAIDALDEVDGDADLEPDDDDCGHDEAEPDFRKRRSRRHDGPGCSISDPSNDEGEREPDCVDAPACSYGLDQRVALRPGSVGFGLDIDTMKDRRAA